MSDESDDRTVAEKQLEQAMDKLHKHHPQIASRLRTLWSKEKAEAAAIERDQRRVDEWLDVAGPQPPTVWERFKRYWT